MLEEISSITARIGEIQQRIAALNGPSIPPAPLAEDGVAPASFAQSLNTKSYPTAMPASPDGVVVPPASLGPLPSLPLTPGAIVPLAPASVDTYEPLIQKYAALNGLEPALVKAVIQTESGGNPRSVSAAGAEGLMQLMPANCKEAGVTDPFDPEQNIAAGTKQLAGLLVQYHGDLDLALAGYNAGPGNVRKYGGVPPFTETQNYIKRVRAAMVKE